MLFLYLSPLLACIQQYDSINSICAIEICSFYNLCMLIFLTRNTADLIILRKRCRWSYIFDCFTWHCYVADFLSDDESPRRAGTADMSIFRNAVKDCLDYDHIPTEKSGKTNRSKVSNDATIEKFSGLRLRYIVVICITKLCVLCLNF